MISQPPVSQPQKKLDVNEATIKTDTNENPITKPWMEHPKENKTDAQLRTELKAIATRKAKDEANKDLEIWKDTEITAAVKKTGFRNCWSCGGINCY